MGVDKDEAAEDGVHGWVEGAGSKWHYRQGDKTRCEQSLEGPVVGAMRRTRRRDRGGVINWRYS